MNDLELDEILDTWTAPAPAESLRDKVRAGFAAPAAMSLSPVAVVPSKPHRRLWTRAILAAAIFIAATQAFPQAMRFFSGEPIPYTVESEFVMYPIDRPPRAYMTITSYNRNGKEVVLSWSFPGNSLGGPLHRTINLIAATFSQITAPLVANPEDTEQARLAANVSIGCANHKCLSLDSRSLGPAADLLRAGCVIDEVVSRETILGYSTVAVRRQLENRARATFWLAPDLGCFALKVEVERDAADGVRNLIGKRAVRVTLFPAR